MIKIKPLQQIQTTGLTSSMIRTQIARCLFSINPDRSNRFFTLKFKLNSPITYTTEYQKLIQQAERKSSLLFAGSTTDLQYFHIFQSLNEIQPYEFLKSTPFYKLKLIQSHQIQQIQMKKRIKDKELAPKHLRQQ